MECTLITVKQLLKAKGKRWVDKPSPKLESIEVLAWAAAAELASWCELVVEPEDLAQVSPETYTVLWGIEAYLKDIGHLPPRPLAHMMLMIERVNRGLTARGDDTEPPQKPN
jgi:hypothetical protein